MKLNLNEIKDGSKWNGYKLPEFDPKEIAENTRKNPEWIHFGAGNIFRIFPAALAQKLLNEGLMNTGIIAGECHDPEIVEKLFKPHDNLTLGVTLKADGSIEKEIIASVVDSVCVYPEFKNDWATVLSAFKNPSLKMLSFTITEKGYAVTSPDGKLLGQYEHDFANPPEKA